MARLDVRFSSCFSTVFGLIIILSIIDGQYECSYFRAVHAATVYTINAMHSLNHLSLDKKGKGSPYSIAERRVPELIPVLGSQPAGEVSHKPGGMLPLISARPAVTLVTLKRDATNFSELRRSVISH